MQIRPFSKNSSRTAGFQRYIIQAVFKSLGVFLHYLRSKESYNLKQKFSLECQPIIYKTLSWWVGYSFSFWRKNYGFSHFHAGIKSFKSPQLSLRCTYQLFSSPLYYRNSHLGEQRISPLFAYQEKYV